MYVSNGVGRTKSNGQGIVVTSLGSAGDDNQERVSGRLKAPARDIGTVQKKYLCCRGDSPL
jgi:hypothetical protein